MKDIPVTPTRTPIRAQIPVLPQEVVTVSVITARHLAELERLSNWVPVTPPKGKEPPPCR